MTFRPVLLLSILLLALPTATMANPDKPAGASQGKAEQHQQATKEKAAKYSSKEKKLQQSEQQRDGKQQRLQATAKSDPKGAAKATENQPAKAKRPWWRFWGADEE